jgi:hypothetical protein
MGNPLLQFCLRQICDHLNTSQPRPDLTLLRTGSWQEHVGVIATLAGDEITTLDSTLFR